MKSVEAAMTVIQRSANAAKNATMVPRDEDGKSTSLGYASSVDSSIGPAMSLHVFIPVQLDGCALWKDDGRI